MQIKAHHRRRIGESEKQSAHGLALLRENEIRPDIRKGPEDKFALGEAWMRQLQIRGLNLQLAEIKEIEIDRPRNIFRMRGRPAEQLFNRGQLVQ